MSEQPITSSLDEKRRNLDAYIKAREKGVDAGLAELADRTDPHALATRLNLLVEAKRFQDGADLVRDLPPHLHWCGTAIHCFVQTGHTTRARELVEWAQRTSEKPARWLACRVAFAESTLMFLKMPPPAFEPVELQPGNLNETQRALLLEAASVLEPAVQAVTVVGRLTSTLETEVVEVALKCHYLLRHGQECQRYYRLLQTRQPVPLLLAHYCLSDWLEIDPPDDLPARLRTEHPGSREAAIGAATVEAIKLGKPNEAFDTLADLLNEESTRAERKEIAELLVGVEPSLDPARQERCAGILPALIEEVDDAGFAVLVKAEMALRKGDAARAAAILDGRPDENNAHWLQLRADCHLAADEPKQASARLQRACEIFPAPTLLRRATDAAFAVGDLDGARAMLTQLSVFEPDDARVLNNLANLAARSNHMREAAGHYARLHTLQPDEPQHLFNEASALVQAGELEAGKRRLDALCENPGRLEREALLSRAQVLKAQNKAADAFRSIEAARAKYWDDIQFAGLYLSLAYASGHDDRGHEALMQILELQKEAGAPQMVRAAPLDEVKDILQARGQAIADVHQEVLLGNLPWLLADSFAGSVPYAAMVFRTQPLPWLGDDARSRESFSVYATNALVYRPEHLTDKSIPLPYEAMPCAPAGAGVVADQTALITLHRLGWLKRCADYFGKVFFPVDYLAQVLEDSNALVFHQPSWLDSLNAIHQAVDAHRISVVDDESGLARVDEYDQTADSAPATAAPYRLRDVIDLLSEQGTITDEAEAETHKLFHQPARAGLGGPNALRVGQTVLMSLTTLRSLANAGHLDALAKTLNIRLGRADYDMLVAETRAAGRHQQTREEHAALWEDIQADPRFVGTPVSAPPEFQEKGDSPTEARHLASVWLADQEKIPLLADDRLLQGLAIYKGARAFGTDRFLVALGQAGILPWDEVAEKFLTLIRWRYRFLLPCPEILVALAKRHAKRPPGQPLRDVAAYVQDCMRDPGLPSGYADATPGSSLAHAVFYRLTAIAGEFAVDVWADGGFEPEAADILMCWIGRSLLPTAPKGLRDGPTTLLVAQSARIMMATAFVRAAVKFTDHARANQALRSIAFALVLDDREYEDILTGVLHED